MSIFDANPGSSMEPERRSIFSHSGFQVGLIGGILMVILHLAFLVVFQGTNTGDLIAWLIQLFLYFILGRVAANKEFRKLVGQGRELGGVQSAGLGAALVMSLIVWLFVIIRSIVRDDPGMFIITNPVGLFCAVVADILIALGLGSLSGKSVLKKQKDY